MTKHFIIPGDTFGRLIVVGPGKRPLFFVVLCECGVSKEVYKGSLVSGATQSCGCWHKEQTAAANTSRKRPISPFIKQPIPDLPGEIWKAVPAWPEFEVSNKGRLKRKYGPAKNDHLRKSCPTVVLTCRGKVVFSGRLAVLILSAFQGPPPNGKPLARHLDDDPWNNDLTNLAWGSYSDNMQDALRNGRHAYRQTAEYGKKISLATTGVPKQRRVA